MAEDNPSVAWQHADVLAQTILSCPGPVTVMSASAGMGKSLILRRISEQTGAAIHVSAEPEATRTGGDLLLWDIPEDCLKTRLTLQTGQSLLTRFQRVIIAKRPQTAIKGLERLLLYGDASQFDDDALLMPAAMADRLFGCRWPLLAGIGPLDAPTCERLKALIERVFLNGVDATTLAQLHRVVNRNAAIAMPDTFPHLPFLRIDAGDRMMAPPDEPLRQIIMAATDSEIQSRMTDGGDISALARALDEQGQATMAIRSLQAAGLEEPAARLLQKNGGVFYIHRHGPEAFNAILKGFTDEIARENETIVLANAMRALKSGEVGRARRLIIDRYGGQVSDPMAVFSNDASYSIAFRGFRLVMMIYDGIVVTEPMFARLYDYLDEIDLDNALSRGSFYNSVLEFYIRQRRLNEAGMAASRASANYREAEVPLLSFYICIHQAVLGMFSGDISTARARIDEASRFIDAVEFESPADERILRLVSACVDYESGKAQALVTFINNEFDTFSYAETWPSLVEFALHYGSQALSEHFSTISALAFLDRWRLYQSHNPQFRFVIEVRAALVMQNGNRWNDAATTLAALQMRINRTWVEAALDELSRLSERDEIEITFAWLRQIVHERPERAYLDRQLQAMIANERVTGRQRLALHIWHAFILKRTNRLTQARAVLQRMFDDAVRIGAIAPLQEERLFLNELMGDGRIETFLHAAGPARQVMRRLSQTGIDGRTIEQQSGLTRREVRILLMICEGASNKFIASQKGISESTVKFHLTNIYRKLGCRKRKEAIAIARARSWLS